MKSSTVRGLFLWLLSGGFLLTAGSCEVDHLTPPEDPEEEEPPRQGDYASRGTETGITFQRALGTSGVWTGDITLRFL
jgi:hypothetical protein